MSTFTHHGKERVRQRVSKGLDLVKVLAEGLEPQEFSGSFRRYLDYLTHKHQKTRVIVHGQHIYVFGYQNALITVLHVPARFKGALRRRA